MHKRQVTKLLTAVIISVALVLPVRAISGPATEAALLVALAIAGPIGGTDGQTLRIIVGLLLPAVQKVREAAKTCGVEVSVQLLDAEIPGDKPLMSIVGERLRAGESVTLDFPFAPSAMGARQEVVARMRTVRFSSLDTAVGVRCPVAATAQLIDDATGVTMISLNFSKIE